MADVVQIGAGGVTKVKSGREFDPQLGFIYFDVYEGNEASVRGLESAFAAAGAHTRVDHEGPVFSIEIRTAKPKTADGQEVPVDKFVVDIDYVQESIWSNPNIIEAAAEAAAAATTETGTPFTADDIIRYWKSLIKERTDETSPDAPTASGFAEPLNQIYANILRGQEAYEIERPVLKQTRTYSTFYAQRIKLLAVSQVYTTAALIALLNLPAEVVAQLPETPTYTPPYTAWGWKKREQSTETVIALDKMQETTSWIFAAWDTLTYNLVADPAP